MMSRWTRFVGLGLVGAVGCESVSQDVPQDASGILVTEYATPTSVTIEDVFTVLPPPAVDVLLVIDNDATMADDQSALALEAWALLDPLLFPGSDTHIGVISTDMDDPAHQGLLQGAWIDATDTTALDDLALAVQLGTGGSATSRPYDAAYAAISGDAASGNPGFYRPSANLLVVVLSDDVDQSDLSVDEFNDWLSQLKASGNQAEWIDLADSNTEDWGSVLSTNSWLSLGMDRWYDLTQTPTPGTIEVEVVEGDVIYGFAPLDWHFDDGRVGLQFIEFVPSPGSVVTIRYEGL